MKFAHTIGLLNGSTQAADDRLIVAVLSTTNVIGSGAGAAVTKAITFAEPMPNANYYVDFEAGQDAVCFASSKTVNGFTLNIAPRLAANTLAVGSVNMLIIG